MMKDSYSFDIDKAGLDRSFDLHDRVYRVDLYALRAQVRRSRGRFGRDGRLAVAGVHGLHRCRRRPDRKLPGMRLRGESGEGNVAARSCDGDESNWRRSAGACAHAGMRARLPTWPHSSKCPRRPTSSVSRTWRQAQPASGSRRWSFLRGDHQVNEAKLTAVLVASELRPMQAEEIEEFFHAPAGFLGRSVLGRRAKRNIARHSPGCSRS